MRKYVRGSASISSSDGSGSFFVETVGLRRTWVGGQESRRDRISESVGMFEIWLAETQDDAVVA